MICQECAQSLEGEAVVVGVVAFHPRCHRVVYARAAGYPFVCPVCKGNPRKVIPAHVDMESQTAYDMGGGGGPGSGGARDFTVPERVEVCEQCHGRGFVAKEPKMVPTGMKWVTE